MPVFEKEVVRCKSRRNVLAKHTPQGIELWCKPCKTWHLITWAQLLAAKEAAESEAHHEEPAA